LLLTKCYSLVRSRVHWFYWVQDRQTFTWHVET